jgi:hypothetical protein
MEVLPKLSHRALTAVLSVFLLFSANYACWSQLLHPVSHESCCTKDGCKPACRIAPAGLEQVTLAALVPTPMPALTASLVDAIGDLRVVHVPPQIQTANDSPPDLYLVHSSFLI